MQLKTAMIFGDRMVIQRDKPFVIWGTAAPGSQVSVRIQGKQGTAKTTESGEWKVQLEPLALSFEEQLEISSGTESLCYKEVQVGEVWLAGGQSNMEFYMRYDADYREEAAALKNENIRFFDYPEVSYEGQLEEYDYGLFGFWRSCDRENLEYYSAVAYYFAKELAEDLKVPIGIIGCNWGGTPACAWMSEESVQKAGEAWLRDYQEGIRDLDIAAYEKEMKASPMNDRTNPFMEFNEIFLPGTTREQQLELMEQMEQPGALIGPLDPWRPCGLYETMLKKLVPYGIRGFLYYQGESDDPKAELYESMLTALIKDWRTLWQEELPFLFVQLAPFELWMNCVAENYPALREAQEQVAAKVPGAWLASIGDVGMKEDIHPKKKQPVGRRLALLARGHVYGEQLVCDAPEYEGCETEGNLLRLHFAHVGEWKLKGEQIQALQIFADGRPASADACQVELSGNQLIVKWNGMPPAEVSVLFAKTNYYEVNLYNEAGIPVKPFAAETSWNPEP